MIMIPSRLLITPKVLNLLRTGSGVGIARVMRREHPSYFPLLFEKKAKDLSRNGSKFFIRPAITRLPAIHRATHPSFISLFSGLSSI